MATPGRKREGTTEPSPNAPKKAKSFSIDEALTNVDHTVEELSAGKQIKHDGNRANQVIESVMQNITTLGAKVPIASLEVEIRIGLSSPAGFRPGVHQEDFDVLMALLNKNRTPTYTEENDYIYNDARGRVTWDSENRRVIRAIEKQTHCTFDIGSNLAYDFRVSLASEHERPYHAEVVEPGHQTFRHKIRASYQYEHWRADLTTVTINGDDRDVKYEVEFELFPSAIPNHKNKERLLDVITRFISEPRNLISALEAPTERTFPEVILEKVSFAEEVGNLRESCLNFFGDKASESQAFPGSMPVNFSRRHFPLIQNSDYFVSEKTDGLRYMMLVTPEAPYFIDRKFDFYMIQGFDILIDIYGANGVTLLDGEMVRNLTTKRPVFMLFDAIQVNGGENAATLPLSKRFLLINEAVGAFREALGNRKIDERSLPFSIIGKRFFQKTQINTLFQEIRTTQEGHEYKDKDAKRHHLTDGLIFTPNIEYQTFTSHHILKWKYNEKLTIDFKYRVRGERGGKEMKRYLTCAGENNTEVDCRELIFSEADNKRLYKDIARARDPNCIIIECNFDTVRGVWKYHTLRHDKHKPNFIHTVFDTMENIAENIATEEVRYRVAVQQKYDDWDAKMRMARDGLLGKLIPGHQSNSHPPPSSSSSRPHPPSSSHHPPTNSHNPHTSKPPTSSHPLSSHSQPPPPSHHPPAPTPKRVPIPASSTHPSSSAASRSSSSSSSSSAHAQQPHSTYEFGDDEDEDAYEEGDRNDYEDEPPQPLPSHTPSRSNGTSSSSTPTSSSSSPSSSLPSNHKSNINNLINNDDEYDDEVTSGGADWQKPEADYEYDDRPDSRDDDE